MVGPPRAAKALTQYGKVTSVDLSTGQPDGVYYEIGARLQKRINNNTGIHGLTLVTFSTSGSVENARLFTSNATDLAIMQADVFENVLTGDSKFLPFNL